MLNLIQSAAPVVDSLARAVANAPPTWQGVVQLFAVSAIVGAAHVINHLVGKPGKVDRAHTLGEIRASITEIKSYVIGPDGQNGLRGDVRELREDVKGILERERQQPRPVGSYDRRTS